MGIAARGTYRARQFWQALRAGPLSAEEQSEIDGVLTSEQMALFREQSEAGQQHGCRVMRTLVSVGHDEDDLLVAALMHDVGKNRAQYTWFDRVKVVLGQRLMPGRASKWAEGKQGGWSKAFVVKANHPEWGAEALAANGGSEVSVSLVRRHQETKLAAWEDNEENRLLALLQRADDQN